MKITFDLIHYSLVIITGIAPRFKQVAQSHQRSRHWLSPGGRNRTGARNWFVEIRGLEEVFFLLLWSMVANKHYLVT